MRLRGSSPVFAVWSSKTWETARAFGGGLREMRIDYGPGYLVYYVRRGAEIVILLCGGDKRTQQRDIQRAQELAERL
jgi:putative addiction module killer protein